MLYYCKQTNKQTLHWSSFSLGCLVGFGGGEASIFIERPLRLAKPRRLWNVLRALQKVKKLKHIPLTQFPAPVKLIVRSAGTCCYWAVGADADYFQHLQRWMFDTKVILLQLSIPHSAVTHYCHILYTSSLTSSTPHISWFSKTKH